MQRDDGLTIAMAETLVDAPISVSCVDSAVRVLLEAGFMAREVVGRLGRAQALAAFSRYSLSMKDAA